MSMGAGGGSKLKIQRALASRPDFKRSHLAVCRKKVLHQRFQAHFPVLNELHRSHPCLLSLGSFPREGLDAKKKKKKKEKERKRRREKNYRRRMLGLVRAFYRIESISRGTV